MALFHKILIFDNAGFLQAKVEFLKKPRITFIFDNNISLKSAAIVAHLLRLLGAKKKSEIFLERNGIAIYASNYILIGILEGKSDQPQKVKIILKKLHQYLEARKPNDVDSYLDALLDFLKIVQKKLYLFEGK